jgi:hypothetical protein
MKKIFAVLLLISALNFKAQYGTINAILNQLEQEKGLNKDLSNVEIKDVQFVLIKNFADHTERNILIVKGNDATYVEVFDDKQTGDSSSNVFSGDVVRSNEHIVSLRADHLEGKKIPMPIVKTFLLTQQKGILYLIDVNTNERWIEQSAITKK